MGLLIAGKWSSQWYDTKKSDGHFVRDTARYRNWVTVDGSPGPSGNGGFVAEPGRYHLYVSFACPWAHRTLIFRQLKGLTEHISVSVVHPLMLDQGWTFETDFDDATGDEVLQKAKLYEVYLHNDPKSTGRVTVPVLWDRQTDSIVSNESSEIIRMFNSAFNDLTGNVLDFWPKALRDEIELVNADVYKNVNNGVYRSGFATTSNAYEQVVQEVFEALDRLELRLTDNRYLLGHTLTEADWRLFTTLIRFDAVYVGHFKCNIRRIADYPALSAYMRELYQMPGIADTVNMRHIKYHYFASHLNINPTGIVPLGPKQELGLAHGRDHL